MSRIRLKTKTFIHYLHQHAVDLTTESLLPEPSTALKLCIVIPSLAEFKRLPKVLESLQQGSRRFLEAEIIVVVNQSDQALDEVNQDNRKTWDWLQTLKNYPILLLAMDRFSTGLAFSQESAGVGLARRMGMDLAFKRLFLSGNLERGAIACLDADSPASPGYIDTLLSIFDAEKPPMAGICQYSHPMPADPNLRKAIVAYELWLRYFELGFQAAGSCFTFPAIGSCMVVSPVAYAQVHGLEARKAGEDFHFLQKIVKVSLPRPLVRIRKAIVFPEARISDRVLFGTGHGMEKSMHEGVENYLQVEAADLFLEVGQLFAVAAQGYKDPSVFESAVSPRLRDFLDQENAWQVLAKLRDNYSTQEQFQLAVQKWMDGLRIIRYVNQATRKSGKVWILDAFRALLENSPKKPLLQQLPDMAEQAIDWGKLEKWLDQLRE